MSYRIFTSVQGKLVDAFLAGYIKEDMVFTAFERANEYAIKNGAHGHVYFILPVVDLRYA